MEPYLDPNDRFRQRRAQSRRRQRLRRTVGAIALLLSAAAVAVGAGALPERGDDTSAEPVAAKRKAAAPPKRTGPPVPKEIRGVHVTMALASLDGKLAEYTRIPGINTIQLDVKDENGEVAFHRLAPTLAKHVGSAMRYYDPGKAAKQVHSEGLFLIGRVVCFEDPILSKRRPDLAIRTSGGAVWQNDAGLGWTNPYEKRVWDYNLRIAQAAARAGFDEIQFDYVRGVPGEAERGHWRHDRALRPLRDQAPQADGRPRLRRRLRPVGDAGPRHRPVASPTVEDRRRDLPHGLPVALRAG